MCRIPTLPLIFPFTYSPSRRQCGPYLGCSPTRAQLRSHGWSNFYSTTRRPVLPWPQVVFTGIIHVIYECHDPYFRRGVIGRDRIRSWEEGWSRKIWSVSLLSSLQSSVDPHISDSPYIYVPVPRQARAPQWKKAGQEM